MSPAHATQLATRLFPHRWRLLAISLFGISSLLTALALGSSTAAVIASTLAGPLIFVPWVLFCGCLWLHPEHGNMQPRSRVVGRLPDLVQRAVRWYASLLMGVFVIVGLVVWPLLALAWL